jgi:hypothetical protein
VQHRKTRLAKYLYLDMTRLERYALVSKWMSMVEVEWREDQEADYGLDFFLPS